MLQMLEGPMIIRSDALGDGHYLAPRGNRLHQGVDYVVTPGEHILLPWSGYLVREAKPYSDSSLTGCVIQSKDMILKVFYVKPFMHLVGHQLPAGTVFALADDVRIKYGSKMTPHIHVEVVSINVDRLFGL
jgi:hypothetical protein